MTDLPVWLQEIRDRADKATEGPWRVVAHGEQDCLARREITAGKHIMIARVDCVPGVAADFDRDYAFIAHARTDVPRLVELVGEMAGALEEAQELLDDLRGAARDAGDWRVLDDIDAAEAHSKAALRKYYGEVNDNDRIA